MTTTKAWRCKRCSEPFSNEHSCPCCDAGPDDMERVYVSSVSEAQDMGKTVIMADFFNWIAIPAPEEGS